LAELEDNEDQVDGVWSSSVLGKEMGLNKGWFCNKKIIYLIL
jgi:hypothetical protein